MGPQEHAFRTGVDILIATPGRLLDHFRFPYAKLEGLEILVLDEADRMLDMGFLPDIRRVLKHLPPSGRRCSSRRPCRRRSQQLTREMLKNPFTVNLERKAAPAVGITQAVYPVAQNLKAPLLVELLEARRHQERARVHAHEAPRQPPRRGAARKGVSCERIHGNRSQAQRTQALAGFKNGQVPRARRHRHRRARHRRRGAVARRQLRRSERPRGLHPPRRAAPPAPR